MARKKSLTRASDWVGHFRGMSNEQLIAHIKDYQKNASWYQGTVIPAVARAELARRKKAGLIRSNAGVPRPRASNPWGF